MSLTDERINEIAASTVAGDVDELANDRLALYEILGDEEEVDELSEDEQIALCDRLEAAVRKHTPDLATILAEIGANDTNYEVRYGLVLRAMAAAAALGYRVGIAVDHAEPEWPVVYIELPTGQVSWHMPAHTEAFDGHTTAEKYQRCRAYTALRESQ